MSATSAANPTSVTGVAVFDGEELLSGRYDVSFDQGTITAIVPAGTGAPADRSVEGAGATLLPGLIDAHVHFSSPAQLLRLARFGVSTALDMGTWPAHFVQVLRGADDGADIRSCGTPLAGPAGPHAHIPHFPAEDLVATPEQARRRVAARLAEGVDYLKIVLERPGAGGPDLETAAAAVEAAHAAGLRVVAHASHTGAVALALEAGADIVAHAPLDAEIDAALAGAFLGGRHVLVPTLTMMLGVARNLGDPGLGYDHARESVRILHRAGCTVLAGTDANDAPGVPASVPHGSSIHDELGLLVEAGLSPIEALRSATSLAADVFGLEDRGRIRPGLRADLLLVDGDPSTDITTSRQIMAVWAAGRRIEPVQRKSATP